MKQKLFLGINQQLKMTPQLQQAIKLLQLSTLELQQEIQENLYTNPLLEIDEDAPKTEQQAETATETQDSLATEPVEAPETEYFSTRKGSGNQIDSDYEFEKESGQTLQEYLDWQLNLSHLSAVDIMIGHAIIDSIDIDGMLTSSLEDICEMTAFDEPPELDECEAVLRRIQRFDPPGIGARDLRECLLIQIELLAEENNQFETAKLIVDKFLPLVSQGNLTMLIKQTRKTEEEVIAALDLLKTLNPRPGAQYNQNEPDYIIPDVVVAKAKGNWTVSLNPETLPKLKLSTQYSELVSRNSTGNKSDNTDSAKKNSHNSDQEYLRDKTQEAKWFLRSLESRHDTLLKVAKSIVINQIDFFEQGPEHMRPLILRDLAEELGFHESTISRATNQKYLSCPAGVFELKYFFSSQVATTSGGEASSTAIKALIAKLIREENPQKPLSDSKLAVLLKQEGMVVARRTVAKYREMQGIESSSARKRFS